MRTLLGALAMVVAVTLLAGERIEMSPVRVAAGAKGHAVLRDGSLLTIRTEARGARMAVICSRSVDGGMEWSEVGVVADDESGVDLGDGHLLELSTGEILCSYRRNRHKGFALPAQESRLEVASSKDGGRTWAAHSTVVSVRLSELASGLGPERSEREVAGRGYWSSFLMQARDGAVHCYLDDEVSPLRAGFARHQWVTRMTWDASRRAWMSPVTVSRTSHPRELARDGMCSVVELASGRLVCVFESCTTETPYANVLRLVSSTDGGASWDWDSGRRVIHAPPNRRLALSPWLAKSGDGRLVCVFATNTDWPEEEGAGAPPRTYHLEIKCLVGDAEGAGWGEPLLVYRGSWRNYLPGVVPLAGEGVMLLQWLEHGVGYRSARLRLK